MGQTSVLTRDTVVTAALCVAVLNAHATNAFAGGVPLPRASAVTRIFDQIVVYSVPQGFHPAYERAEAFHYIQELVPEGESDNHWTQMVTLTGEKGLAANPSLTPKRFLMEMAVGFRRACPTTFAVLSLGSVQVDGFDGYGSVLSCGEVLTETPLQSETALIIVLKGESDYYTVQWAEHGKPSLRPMAVDERHWRSRYETLMPIRLYPPIPSERSQHPGGSERSASSTGR